MVPVSRFVARMSASDMRGQYPRGRFARPGYGILKKIWCDVGTPGCSNVLWPEPAVTAALCGKSRRAPMNKNTICLWYNHDAEEAAQFYAKTFPEQQRRRGVHQAPSDFPGGKAGQVLTVQFTVCGVPCIGLNGGDMFKHSEAFSFQIATEDQAETDRYWNAIVGNGGTESAVRLVQGQMGPVVADHPARPDRRDGQGRRRRQARVRGDDADGEDRRREDRGRGAGMRRSGVRVLSPHERMRYAGTAVPGVAALARATGPDPERAYRVSLPPSNPLPAPCKPAASPGRWRRCRRPGARRSGRSPSRLSDRYRCPARERRAPCRRRARCA